VAVCYFFPRIYPSVIPMIPRTPAKVGGAGTGSFSFPNAKPATTPVTSAKSHSLYCAINYIRSGALTPIKVSALRRTVRVASQSRRRACVSGASSVTTRQRV
jgi:hypothetical protein